MNRVVVYVEGPSDKAAMEALLAPILADKQARGTAIQFFEAPSGDRKKTLLTKIPIKAVNILMSQMSVAVVAVPDLYPKNKAFPHETFAELERGIIENFYQAANRKGVSDPQRLGERFKVFCFKHDLEALLLASRESLKARLEAPELKITWTLPVEDQNHDKPPKRVVEALFEQHGQRYKETVDAPMILQGSHYQKVAEECQQCFKPFVSFLESL